MKGYVILIAVTLCLIVMLPPLVLGPPSFLSESDKVDSRETAFSVMHTDQSQKSDMDTYGLTLYEMMATMPSDAPEEALKAQAVASYTSFCYQTETEGCVTATTLPFPEAFSNEYWQTRWGEAFEETVAVYRRALDAVFGTVAVFDGQPIMAVYHTMNSGKTENAQTVFGEEIPYLVSAESKADALDLRQLTTVSVPMEETKQILEELGNGDAGDPSSWFGDVQKSEAGTVLSLTVNGKTYQGGDIQTAFSLPSAAFETAVQENEVIFTVHGYGHFVGMSAVGAAAMATEGRSFEEILKWYYHGVSVEKQK